MRPVRGQTPGSQRNEDRQPDSVRLQEDLWTSPSRPAPRVTAPIVEVGGEIDVYTAPRLREQLVDLVADGKYHLVVDMERVDFLDSTGLGVLVGGLKRVRAHDGSLRLVCTQERILKIFRITGLTKVFPIHASVDEAVAQPSERVPQRRKAAQEGPGWPR